MAEVVGTAWVRIRALTTGLAGEINDALGKVDTDPISKKMGDRVGGTMGKGVTDGFQAHLSENGLFIPDTVVKKAASGLTETFTDEVQKSGVGNALPNAVDTPQSRSLLSRIGSKLSTIFHAAFSKTSTTEHKKETASWEKHLKSFTSHLKKLKVPLPIWIGYFGMPIIVGLVKTLTFYIGGLVARIGSMLEGLTGVGAAAVGAFVQTAAVGALIFSAFKTQTLALAAFQAEIKKVGGEWREVGAATQQFLLPGVLSSFRDITKSLVPVFKDLGTYVGAVANNTLTAVAALLTGERGMRMWEGFNASTKVTSANLGRITTALARAFIPLMDALNPLAEQFSDAIASMVERWASLLEIASDSGSLQDTLQGWYDTGMKLFGALGDIFAGLWNILRIGSDASGLAALDRFDQFAERFREWTKSVEGENKIRKFFEEAEPVIREVNGLIADIFRTFFQGVDTGTGSDTIVSVLQQLRYEILPKVAEGIKGISDSFAGENGDNATKLVSVLADLLDVIVRAETLVPTIQIITLALEGLVFVLNLPVVGPLAGTLLAVGAALRLFPHFLTVLIGHALLGVAHGIDRVVIALTGGNIVSLLKSFKAGLMGGTVSVGGLHTALANLGGSLTGLGPSVSVAAGPIILALAAIGIASYFWLEPVRKLIDDLWEEFQGFLDLLRSGEWGEAAKALGSLLFDIVALPITYMAAAAEGVATKIIEFVGNIPGWVAGAASAMWGWITDSVSQGGGKLSEWWESAKTWLSELPGKITTAVSDAASAVWDWLVTAVPLAAEKVGAFFASLPGAFSDLATKVGEAVSGAASAVWDWLTTAVNEAPGKIGYFIGQVLGKISTLPELVGSALLAGASALWSWIQQAIPQAGISLTEFVSSIWNAITTFVTELPGRISGAISGITQWVADSVPVLTENVGNWATNVWNWISNFVSEIPGRIMGAITALVSWVSEAARQLPAKLLEFATVLMNWATGLPGQVLGWIGDIGLKMLDVGWSIIEGIWSGISAAGGWLWDKIKEFAGGIVSGFLDAISGGSPAMELVPVGSSIVQGIALGITSNANRVNDAFTDLMDPYMGGKWAANLDPFGGAIALSTSSMVSAALVSSTPQVGIIVKIGERDITDIVDTQVEKNNIDLARQLVARNA